MSTTMRPWAPNLGHSMRVFNRFEIGLFGFKPKYLGGVRRRNALHIGIVGGNCLIIAHALNRNAVFSPGNFVHEFSKRRISFELGITFDHNEKGLQGSFQASGRFDFLIH